MNTPKPKEFKRVRETAEKALEEFVSAGLKDQCIITDLSVVDVGWCLHEDGDHEWVITIEEASPEAYKLQGFMVEVLGVQGIAARIITEW